MKKKVVVEEETHDEEKLTIVTIEGKDYVTFPQTLIFTKIERGTLQQQVNRNKLKVKKIGKYVFVPYDIFVELLERNETQRKMKLLQELVTNDLSMEEIERLVEETKQNRKIN